MKKLGILILTVILVLSLSACAKVAPAPTATPAPTPTIAPTPTLVPTPSPEPTLTSEAATTAFLAAVDKNTKLTKSAYTGTMKTKTSGITIDAVILLESNNDSVNPMKHIKITMGETNMDYFLNNTYIASEALGIKTKIKLPTGANIVTGEGLDSFFQAAGFGKQVYPMKEEMKSVSAKFEKGGWRLTFELTPEGQKKLGAEGASKFSYSCYINAGGYIGEETVAMDITAAGISMSIESTMILSDITKDVVIAFPDLKDYKDAKYADTFGV